MIPVLNSKVLRALKRRVARSGNPFLWYGISEIAAGIGSKKAVRRALNDLLASGDVARFDASNGTFWRAA